MSIQEAAEYFSFYQSYKLIPAFFKKPEHVPDFSDVPLASADHKNVLAHKPVLESVSGNLLTCRLGPIHSL